MKRWKVAVSLATVGALSALVTGCGVPDMTCRAEQSVKGRIGSTDVFRLANETDVFRVANGRLYHRRSGREEEYFYNDIRKVELGRYVSGHMVFLMDYDRPRGYVVIAAPYDWRVVSLDCRS